MPETQARIKQENVLTMHHNSVDTFSSRKNLNPRNKVFVVVPGFYSGFSTKEHNCKCYKRWSSAPCQLDQHTPADHPITPPPNKRC